jgi:hypothetical protein
MIGGDNSLHYSESLGFTLWETESAGGTTSFDALPPCEVASNTNYQPAAAHARDAKAGARPADSLTCK